MNYRTGKINHKMATVNSSLKIITSNANGLTAQSKDIQ
jgi:hypothetical protein